MQPQPPQPAGVWRTLFAFSGLALVVGTLGFLVMRRAGHVDPQTVVGAAFEVGALPAGLSLVSALELPDGQRIVSLTPGVATRPPVPDTPAPETTPGEGPPDEKIVWRKLPIAPAATPPAQVQLFFFGADGQQAVRRSVEGELARIEHLEPRGGTVGVESGTLRWDAYEPRFLHTRRFTPPGSYQDTLAIDLSAHGRWCVLFAVWNPNETGSKEALFEIARALKPKPKDPEPGSAGVKS